MRTPQEGVRYSLEAPPQRFGFLESMAMYVSKLNPKHRADLAEYFDQLADEFAGEAASECDAFQQQLDNPEAGEEEEIPGAWLLYFSFRAMLDETVDGAPLGARKRTAARKTVAAAGGATPGKGAGRDQGGMRGESGGSAKRGARAGIVGVSAAGDETGSAKGRWISRRPRNGAVAAGAAGFGRKGGGKCLAADRGPTQSPASSHKAGASPVSNRKASPSPAAKRGGSGAAASAPSSAKAAAPPRGLLPMQRDYDDEVDGGPLLPTPTPTQEEYDSGSNGGVGRGSGGGGEEAPLLSLDESRGGGDDEGDEEEEDEGPPLLPSQTDDEREEDAGVCISPLGGLAGAGTSKGKERARAAASPSGSAGRGYGKAGSKYSQGSSRLSVVSDLFPVAEEQDAGSEAEETPAAAGKRKRQSSGGAASGGGGSSSSGSGGGASAGARKATAAAAVADAAKPAYDGEADASDDDGSDSGDMFEDLGGAASATSKKSKLLP
ncbi:unnamed protein product [Phaeothamnion confervicola]